MRLLESFPDPDAVTKPFILFIKMWNCSTGAKCSIKKVRSLLEAKFPEFDLLQIDIPDDNFENYFFEELEELEELELTVDGNNFPTFVQAVLVYGPDRDQYFIGDINNPNRCGVAWYYIDELAGDGPEIAEIK